MMKMKKIIEEMENNLKNAQEGLEGIKICLNDKPDNDRLRFMLGRKIELEKKRNDDNLRSCRRSKSVRLLKSSTSA